MPREALPPPPDDGNGGHDAVVEQLRRQVKLLQEQAESTPDLPATLRGLARLAVPLLADRCAIYLSGDDGQLRLVHCAEADVADEPRGTHACAVSIPAGHPLRRCMETGEPLVVPALDEMAGGESRVVVPLRARGRTLGALSLAGGPGRRPFQPRDAAAALDFAQGAALAVDGALRAG